MIGIEWAGCSRYGWAVVPSIDAFGFFLAWKPRWLG